MKLQQLYEASYHGRPKRLHTETGTAELHTNGEMVLDNSGYETRLSKKEVKQIWNGAKKINRGRYWATFDGYYWIFDEAMHIVPEEWKFEDTEFHSRKHNVRSSRRSSR